MGGHVNSDKINRLSVKIKYAFNGWFGWHKYIYMIMISKRKQRTNLWDINDQINKLSSFPDSTLQCCYVWLRIWVLQLQHSKMNLW